MKNLTVQQKHYLTKRIDTITNEKIGAINQEYEGKIKYRSGMSSQLDLESVEGLLAGKVKLRTSSEILKTVKERYQESKRRETEDKIARAAGRYYGGRQTHYITLGTFDFVDKDSVEKYNSKRDAEAQKINSEKSKRINAVTVESTKVKDKIILEGSTAAVALLEEFANKKF
jgi:hypothetical protein